MKHAKFKKFKTTVWDHYRMHGRHSLPWRKTKNPYRILVSEMMLQQTQVARVLRYYPPFIKKFPNFTALASTSLRDVLAAWQGLGYNRRALLLKRCAEKVRDGFHGALPRDPALLITLPGIGPATAGAITTFVYNIPFPFIETNIRRVFIHFFFRGKHNIPDAAIMPLVAKTLNRKNPREWFWALMDYGAMLAQAAENPNRRSRIYKVSPKFRGSQRELRGKILRLMIQKKIHDPHALARHTAKPINHLRQVLSQMKKEGFVTRRGEKFFIALRAS